MQDKSPNKIQPQDEVVDIRSYFSTIKKYWLPISLFTTLTTAIVMLIVQSMTPIYRATAVLLIEAQHQKAVSIEDVVGIDTSKEEYYQTQFEIIKSNNIAERVINKLHLSSLPEFNGHRERSDFLNYFEDIIKLNALTQIFFPQEKTTTTEQQLEEIRQTVLETFKEKLTVSPIRKTQLVEISFESEDPVLAARIANEVGNSYIESHLDARLTMTAKATNWLGGRMNGLKQQLINSEERLSSFLQQEGLIDLSGINGLASTELSDLTTQLSTARDRRIAAESLSRLLKNNKSADLDSLSSVPEISNHPQMRDIRLAELDAERRVSELSKIYGPKHDKMIQAQAQLKAVKHNSRALLTQLAKGIDKERQAARHQELTIQQTLASKKAEYQQLAVKEAKYDSLKREVDSNREIYDLFLTRQKETSATGDFKSANASFSDYAMTPLNASKPQKAKTIAVTGAGSMMLAIIMAFMFESLRNTIERIEDVEDKLGLQQLGSIPAIKLKKFKKKPIDSSLFFETEQQFFTESIRSIRTSLLLNLANQKRKQFVVTSSIPGEGKTTAAINLAMSMAAMEKVLLIDCDLRRPSVGERFGLPDNHPGISNILSMDTAISECVYHDNRSGLDILPSGLKSPTPQELLSSAKLTALFNQLDTYYDRIVIDTPPALVVSDALVLGRSAGATIVVVKAGETKLKQITTTMSKMIKHDITIDGVILNKLEKKHYDFYEHYKYYDDYKSNAQNRTTMTDNRQS